MSDNQTLCVVLSRPDRPIPGELRSLLESRDGVRLETSQCAYDALARVLRQSRADDRQRVVSGDSQNSGTQRMPIVFLMVEPIEIDMAAPTLEAAQRFAPHAACWQYDPAASPKMRPIAEGDSRHWQPETTLSDTGRSIEVPRRIAAFVPGTASRSGVTRAPIGG